MANLFKNDIQYLDYLSTEYEKTARKIIRSKDKHLIEKSFIAPSFIDSSEGRLIGTNDIGYSFRTCVTNAILKNRLSDKNRILNGFLKKDTADFLKQNSYSVPTIYEYDVNLENVLNYERCIIKPIRGANSRGIFIKDERGYLDLGDKQLLKDYESFKEKYKSYSDLGVIIEELIADYDGKELEPARDVKIYSFYGSAPIALEIIRKDGENYHCYYDDSLNIINDCLARERKFFEGQGFDKEIFDVAKEVSRLIPLPFIRIDFLVTSRHYKLGELTAMPGYYSRFKHHYDKSLGKEFLSAENRLTKDLLEGKKFHIMEEK